VVRSLIQAELAQDFFVWDAFSPSERRSGAVQCRSCFGRDVSFFHGCVSDCEGDWFEHGFKQTDHGRELRRRKAVNQFVSLLFFTPGIMCHRKISKLQSRPDYQSPIQVSVKRIQNFTGTIVDDFETAKAPNFDKIQYSSTSGSQTIQQESLRTNKIPSTSTRLGIWFGTRRPVVQIHSPRR
jgi:hypothetical protein